MMKCLVPIWVRVWRTPVTLEVRDLTGGYGRLQILNGIDLQAEVSDITLIIGPNGAGKSTLLKTIYGFLKPMGGSIRLDGASVLGWKPRDLLRIGLQYIPQGRSIFPYLTVEENLRMGAFILDTQPQVRGALERAYAMFPVLKERRRQLAGSLSGGERRFVELARILMVNPRLVLLDEPSLGMAPGVMEELYHAIRRLHSQGVGFLLVEQNVRQGLRVAHKVYILRLGRVEWAGPPAALLDNRTLRALYLGGEVNSVGPPDAGD
jgi:ABC-type branched-subunit amino acid transport system ATPase component